MINDIFRLMFTDRGMSRKSRHNAAVRTRILEAAGPLFRRHGIDGVGIDALMAAAGLTRGAFYAHFASKAALYEAAMQEGGPLLALLSARTDSDPAALWARMRQVFGFYLGPRQFDTILPRCTLTALTRDAANMEGEGEDAPAQAGLTRLHAAIRDEMARGQPIAADDPRIVGALTLAVGAMNSAAATGDPGLRAMILTAARDGVMQLTDPAPAT